MIKELFENLLVTPESEGLEFKEAKTQYDFEKLVKYCVAIANERGGRLVLGVTNSLPHKVVGTTAYPNYKDLQKTLLDTIHIRIEIEEFFYNNKRALIFNIPSRPYGQPLQYRGSYYMRSGESLTSMTSEMLKEIFNEIQPDFSSGNCKDATFEDLSDKALENFRRLLYRKSGNLEYIHMSVEQLLCDTDLFDGKRLNYAALILLGTKSSLTKYLSNAEIIFEYRKDEAIIEAQQRKEFREGFLAVYDELWDIINLRNEVNHIQDGFFVKDVPSFNEEVIREAILNSICHRDYTNPSSIFIKQFPKTLEVESPGGFPTGVTPENILTKQIPRNRRIAEVFQKCGLVERSGQGVDKMYRRAIEESKQTPDFQMSDRYNVKLKVVGDIQDVRFLMFLEKVSSETPISLSVHDLLLLEDIRRGFVPDTSYNDSLSKLRDFNVIEPIGVGKGRKFILSKQFYTFLDEKGVYTRKKGLDNEEKKALLLKHLKNYGKGTIKEFSQVLPSVEKEKLKYLIKQLRMSGQIHYIGKRNRGYWELVDTDL